MTQPAGVGFSARSSTSIFPRWVIDVAASYRKGNSSSLGAPKAIGFVPKSGSTPNVGAIDGRALVKAIPIIPCSTAISG